MHRRWPLALALWMTFAVEAESLRAADEAKVKAAINRGRVYLAANIKNASKGGQSLAAYSLLKSGTAKTDPLILETVAQALEECEKLQSQAGTVGENAGAPFHETTYTVACHIFLLEAVDPVAYKPQLTIFAKHLEETQLASGSWFYDKPPSDKIGDTSQSQFALLGLWAAARADVEISSRTWERAVGWLLRTQRDDGGFCYQPSHDLEQHRKTTLSATLAGAGSLLLTRYVCYPDQKFGDEVVGLIKAKPKHGVLQQLKDGQAKRVSVANLPVSQMDSGVSRALKVVDLRFEENSEYFLYQLYSMERTAALLDTETLGKHDWYQEVSDILVLKQLADGSWSDNCKNVPATSFAILALSRATAQILGKPAPGKKKVGGGLLAGARGLPSDLSKLNSKDGGAAERKSKGDVDDLLAELEKVQDVSVAEVQQSILESVNLEDRDQLVGQVVRLKRLADDPRAEVRRTVCWAMGRSGDVRLAPILIRRLKDVDVDVIREASFGLTVLSRKPTGILDNNDKLIAVDPLDGLDEDVTDEARQSHLEQWIAKAEAAWKKWYFSVRPYEERDDRQTLQRKK